MMRSQHFGRAVHPHENVVIETPVGFITITGKNIKVDLPACLRAHKGMDRAVQHARWLRMDGETVRPAYAILSPVVDTDGGIAGVESPNEFIVACGGAENHHE